MTTTLRFKIRARQRISAGRHGAVGNVTEAHDVLPGSVLRGALAAVWRREHDMGSAATVTKFRRLFESDCVFGQAEPDPAEVSLVGTSEVWCKYPEPGCRHPIVDTAFAPQGPRCDGGVETGKGWRRSGRLRVVTRGALDARGVADEGQLFSRETSSPTEVYEGVVLLDDGADAFRAWLTEPRQLLLGGGLSIQGAADWTAVVEPDAPTGNEPESAVLRLRSPLIAVDVFGAPTLDPSGVLGQALGGGVAVTAETGWLRSVRLGGWHAPSGLPKPEEWAIASGSTVHVGGLPPGWRGLLARGVGLRHLEGYGQLIEVLAPSDGCRPEITQVVEAPSLAVASAPVAPTMLPPEAPPPETSTESAIAPALEIVEPAAAAASVAELKERAEQIPTWAAQGGIQGPVEATLRAIENEGYRGTPEFEPLIRKGMNKPSIRRLSAAQQELVRQLFETAGREGAEG